MKNQLLTSLAALALSPAAFAAVHVTCELSNLATGQSSSHAFEISGGGNATDYSGVLLQEAPSMIVFAVPANGDLSKAAIMISTKTAAVEITASADLNVSPLSLSDGVTSISCRK